MDRYQERKEKQQQHQAAVPKRVKAPLPPEEDEEDETFVALQKLLRNLAQNQNQNTNKRDRSDNGTYYSSQQTEPTHRLSQEELLESRRRERERFRHIILSRGRRRENGSRGSRRRCALQYYSTEDEEEEEEPRVSVESTISNRVMNGSFSRFNVRVISRDRWSTEEEERLPIILLPTNGKVVSPAENPKLNVVHTDEHLDLRTQLIAHFANIDQDEEPHRLLAPPRSTWYIQMRDFDPVPCTT